MLRCLCKNVNASKSTYIYMYSTYTCNIKHTTLKLTKFSGRAHYILFLFCSFLTERAHTRCFYYKSYRRLFIFILSFISLLYSLYCIFVCGSNAHRAQCERQPSEHKYKKWEAKQNYRRNNKIVEISYLVMCVATSCLCKISKRVRFQSSDTHTLARD